MLKPVYSLAVLTVLLGRVDYFSYGQDYTPANCPVVGNVNSRIYHTPGGHFYTRMLRLNKEGGDNRQCFKSPAQAQAAGFRAARR